MTQHETGSELERPWHESVSQAEHHHCRERSIALCDSLVAHVFSVRWAQIWTMSPYRWPKVCYVRRPRSPLWLQRRRVMCSAGCMMVAVFTYYLSFPSHVCVVKMSSQLVAIAALSSSLRTRFFSPCGLSCWAVMSACQSRHGVTLCTWGQLLCMSDLWALQQEGLLRKCTEHGWTWVCSKSGGCLAASIFTRFIIESIFAEERGEMLV